MECRRDNLTVLTWSLVIACLVIPTGGHTILKDAAAGSKPGDPMGFLQGVFRHFESSKRNSEHSEPPSKISDSDLARMIFRYADLSGTTSARLLENTPDSQWTLEELKEKLTEERLTEALYNLVKDLKRPSGDTEGPEPFAGPEEWDNDCYRDLASFIEPITDVLLNGALELLPKTDVGDFVKAEIKFFYLRGPEEKEIPEWGLSILDAFFKLPAALADGNLHWVGGYEMCNKQQVSYFYNMSLPHEDRAFNAQYCRVEVVPRPVENQTASSLILTLGMCVPDSCSPENVTSFLSDATDKRGSTRILGIIQEVLEASIQDVFCGHGELDVGSDPPARASTIVLLIFIALITAGTLWDGVFRQMWLRKCLAEHAPQTPPETPPPEYESVVEPSPNHQPSLQRPLSVASTSGLMVNDYNMATVKGATYWQEFPGIFDRIDLFLVAFSAYNNLRRLVRVDSTPRGTPGGRLTPVDAVKYLAMGHLLLGQTYLLGPVVSFVLVTPNIVPNLRTLPTQWNFMPILGFHYTVDTFFVCSGLLVTLYWFRRIQQNSGRLTPWLVIRNILHWYWRLMPSMMMVMMIFVVFYKYLASGPLSARSIPFAENCKPNWWTNILMVQNLVNLDKQCMAWTWYFSAVFQLHLVASVIFIVYHFIPIGSYVLMSALFCVHIGVTAAKSNSLLEKGILGSFRDWNSYLFITPWAHAGSYLIGVSLAFILRDLNFKANLNVGWRVLGWLVGVGLIVLVTYVPYDMYRDLDLDRWTRAAKVTYDTLSRPAWGLGVAWILFACITGNGGFIGEVLSWRAFQPLGRLTYSMYIMHAIAILRYMYNRMSLLYVAENEMVYLFFGNFVMTHIYGLLCTILFEYPFRGLERMVSCRTKLDAMLAGTHPKLQEDTKDTMPMGQVNEKKKFINEKGRPVELEMSTHI